MSFTFPQEIKFTIGTDEMSAFFNQALELRVALACHVRDSSRPRVDELFSMMSLAGCIVEALKRSIKEQIPEAEIGA